MNMKFLILLVLITAFNAYKECPSGKDDNDMLCKCKPEIEAMMIAV